MDVLTSTHSLLFFIGDSRSGFLRWKAIINKCDSKLEPGMDARTSLPSLRTPSLDSDFFSDVQQVSEAKEHNWLPRDPTAWNNGHVWRWLAASVYVIWNLPGEHVHSSQCVPETNDLAPWHQSSQPHTAITNNNPSFAKGKGPIACWAHLKNEEIKKEREKVRVKATISTSVGKLLKRAN